MSRFRVFDSLAKSTDETPRRSRLVVVGTPKKRVGRG